MKIHILSLLLACFLIASPVHADEINAGFVQGLWYSSDQILEGVPVRVYAALRNNTPHDLLGTVRFMDNGKRIGSAPVSALSGRLVETWIDWTPTYGEHSLSVSLSDAELHVIGGEIIQADVASITVADTLLADRDTDKDGIGNQTDTDDDGDEVSDSDETAHGSDPLIANPKPKVVEAVEEEKEEPEAETPAVPTEVGDGLEQYLDDGVASTLLGNVTEKVENAKQSLDAYREARNEALKPKEEEVSKETTLGTYTDNATITRSKIETDNNLLSAFISGVASIFQKIYTLLLWVLSGALAHPAFIQLFLLVGILYMFYRTARRFGRRPN